ncbi:ATP:cob(I)alamin adenosyltransferase [Candidatus Gottesmanbacteria bacterium RBG_13_37_7]|uniref:Corrinoid adenosyltransferase n=1 Tax=Candidatus Gottesmanbacteria bacterium RBG_13_37_7 TaxID=1798369 RepID=A0A1F5YIL7_9BACT|nr:MAG: ATP:cob(I)alamin adenosyltransferase [Candidatus Gottesmanbacteria bacterium RBG_13_37_7]
MTLYTKTGDSGQTSFFGGKRVFKNHLRINAYGSIDELNSVLGLVMSKLDDKRVEDFINTIQKDLFRISSHLAGAVTNLTNIPARVNDLEKIIDNLVIKLPNLSNFILPEGIESATLVFFARSVARRTERELVALSREEKIDSAILMYFNRLSDLLFIIARYLNFKAGVLETIWEDK